LTAPGYLQRFWDATTGGPARAIDKIRHTDARATLHHYSDAHPLPGGSGHEAARHDDASFRGQALARDRRRG
jgi:hypothetical protein